MQLSTEVSHKLERYQKGCHELCSAVGAFLDSPSLAIDETHPTAADVGTSFSGGASLGHHLDRARAHIALARGVQALTVLLLRGKGCDTGKGGLPAELERIKQHEKKVRRWCNEHHPRMP